MSDEESSRLAITVWAKNLGLKLYVHEKDKFIDAEIRLEVMSGRTLLRLPISVMVGKRKWASRSEESAVGYLCP